MSAAFPYVSPVAKADQPAGAQHLADGGYFDNSGLFSLTQWLKQGAQKRGGVAGSPRQQPATGKRFLILQVDAFPDWGTGKFDSPNERWFFQIWAPLSTILSVRSEGAVIRDDSEGKDLLELLAGRGYETTQITVRYEPDQACPAKPPLSWHLTPLEQSCIVAGWGSVRDPLVQEVKLFLQPRATAKGAAAKAAPPAPLRVEETVWKPALGFYVRKTIQ
jgi:hypothetical protein